MFTEWSSNQALPLRIDSAPLLSSLSSFVSSYYPSYYSY